MEIPVAKRPFARHGNWDTFNFCSIDHSLHRDAVPVPEMQDTTENFCGRCFCCRGIAGKCAGSVFLDQSSIRILVWKHKLRRIEHSLSQRNEPPDGNDTWWQTHSFSSGYILPAFKPVDYVCHNILLSGNECQTGVPIFRSPARIPFPHYAHPIFICWFFRPNSGLAGLLLCTFALSHIIGSLRSGLFAGW